MVMVFACSKENATEKPTAKQELTAYETHINKTLKDFKQKMEFIRANPNLKSGESVPADSAVWLLEATINFSHAFPNEFYSEFETDSLTLTVARNADGTVDMEELTGKYDEMKQAVADAYHNSGYEVKGLAVVDLTETTVTESEIIINVEAITGSRGVDPGPGFDVDGPFVEGDDWWYGEDEGKCDTATSSDAAQQLRIAMNNYIPDPNGNYFFINLFQIDRTGGNPNVRRTGDPEPPNNVYDYYLYSASEAIGPVSDDMKCLEYTEMNFYFSFLKHLLFTKLPQGMPPGYGIVTVVNMEGNWEWIEQYTTRHYYHRGYFQYGEKIYYDEEPIEL
jgi:hypothetical protein